MTQQNSDTTTGRGHVATASEGRVEPYLSQYWSTDYLEAARKRADPLADKVMELLYAEGRADAERSGDPADRPKRLMRFLLYLIDRLSIPDPEAEHPFAEEDPNYTFTPEVREAMRAFIASAPKLPDWTDLAMVEHAQELFSDNPLVAYVLLAGLSLPVLYTCGRGGTQVLVLTEQITTKVRRRIIETGSMIMSVMQKGSFTVPSANSSLSTPLPPGIEATLRVRLLHAASRTMINEFWIDGKRDAERDRITGGQTVRSYHGMKADQLWRDEWGIPISQQYLAGTLMTFSYTTIFGLERLGVPMTDADQKAFMHLWNVFGYVLGIEEEMLLRLDFPQSARAEMVDGKPVHAATGDDMMATGRALYKQLMDINRSVEPNAIRDGRILTAAINDYLADLLRRKIPMGKFLGVDRIPRQIMSALLSRDDRKLLGIETTLLDHVFMPIILLLFRLRGDFVKEAKGPSEALAHMLLKLMQEDTAEAYTDVANKPGIRYPGIPMEFQKKWGLVKS